MTEQPPTLDIGGLVQGDPGALVRVAAELEAPCVAWGVFHVTGHGIPASALGRFEACMRAFFGLSRAQKRALRRTRENARGYYDEELTKNRPDWKEVFDYGAEREVGSSDAVHSDGINQWPSGLPGFRETLLAHYDACERVGLALLRALCVSLGAAPDALAHAFVGHSSFVRLNRYPPCPDPAPANAPLFPERGAFGVHHHTDAGALTLLVQDAVGGLQVRHGGRFVVIQPVEGALAVNLGDMLQVWSNDRYVSPLHRVLAPRARERLSAPFFLNPSYTTTCRPLLGRPGEPSRYRPISWSHFRDQRSAGDYADYGHEIQISDFRIPADDEADVAASCATRSPGSSSTPAGSSS